MKKILLKIISIILLIIICIYPLHTFLCLDKPINAEILVVEGWILPEYFPKVIEEYNRGKYQLIITTGAYISPSETYLSDSTFADRAATKLIEYGMDKNKIVRLPWSDFQETKTYSSFIPLKNWLQNQEPQIKSLNLYTASVHARKSHILCRKALGDKIQIGVISGPTMEYNPRLWIFSKRGIWLVFKNTSSLIVNIFQK